MSTRFEQAKEWFILLSLGDRMRLLATACCSNPNPTLQDDIVTGSPVIRCGNCGADT